ncbi:MAG: methyltransferase [Acidimicrobiales bacterium]
MLLRRRRSVVSQGRRFDVPRGVFNPEVHLSGVAFANHLADELDHYIAPQSRVLDLGTGCGILAAVVCENAARTVASDANPEAVECAARNLAGLSIEVLCGDLFEPVRGERFDIVVCNPPYDIGPSRDRSLGSPDFLARFGREVHDHADTVLLAYPADEAENLDLTGLAFELDHRIRTKGEDLGIFVATTASLQ